MPLGISTGFDQRYDCRTCDVTDMDWHDDFDRRTWRCSTCHEPIWIHMANEAGDTQLVERHPACELIAGDYIVLEHDISLGLFEVKASQPAMGKGNKWYLGIEQNGHHRPPRDQYYNCMPRG
ncbi:hypothetical protein [Pseudomonas sp. SG20052]|uniref:hypothetical protein n=1 Tax=Pseudomonas sp. SG20052 TaxID=3074147 RepID=UPI00287F949E|nr:hypothetical protein [Pseudomonas sp. SG20052]WNF54232.1 hypothetical protein RHP74_23310 [Pseudomonas sp. SG20052]